MKKISVLFSIYLLFSLVIFSCASTGSQNKNTEIKDSGYKYIHNPEENPSAMADIVVNPDAVYGFSPNPESKRLGSYADYDWTDPEFVATARKNRSEYFQSMKIMYSTFDEMVSAGKSTEEIARTISALRNQIRLESYKNDPEGLKKVKMSNLETYGNENGPSADSLFEKYKSWETVLLKAFSTNSGMDACTGFYDDNFELYVRSGLIK